MSEIRKGVIVQFLECMEEIIDSDGSAGEKADAVQRIAREEGFENTLEEFFSWGSNSE